MPELGAGSGSATALRGNGERPQVKFYLGSFALFFSHQLKRGKFYPAPSRPFQKQRVLLLFFLVFFLAAFFLVRF